MQRQADKYDRLSMYSLVAENKATYGARADEFMERLKGIPRFRTGNKDTKSYVRSKEPLYDFRALPRDWVVNILKKESEEWRKLLNEKERYAIKKYTKNRGDTKTNKFYMKLNAMLRGDEARDKKFEDYAKIISNSIKKNNLSQM